MDQSSNPPEEIPEDRLGQALSSFAIAGGFAGDGGEPLIVAELLEAIDGVVAGVVVGEDLREEDAEGDPGSVDPLTPGMIVFAAGGLDESPGQVFEEGESLLVAELVSEGIEWAWRR